MKKENIMCGVVGLVAGTIVGFVFANSVNKTGTEKTSVQTTASIPGPANSLANNPAIPADHPPLTGSSGDATRTAPLPQVMESIEKAKQQPQDYEAQMTAADLYYQIQRFDDAAKYYEAANKLKPGEAEPLIKAGNAHFDNASEAAKRDDEQAANTGFMQAEKWYLLALEKEPKNINVRTDLGLTFFLRSPRNIDRSIKEYKVSLGIDPNHEITLQNLVLAYNENADKDNLRTTIEKLKKINPNNPAVTKIDTAL